MSLRKQIWVSLETADRLEKILLTLRPGAKLPGISSTADMLLTEALNQVEGKETPNSLIAQLRSQLGGFAQPSIPPIQALSESIIAELERVKKELEAGFNSKLEKIIEEKMAKKMPISSHGSNPGSPPSPARRKKSA